MNKILFILPSLNKGGSEKVLFEIFDNIQGFDKRLIVFKKLHNVKDNNIINYESIRLKDNISNLIKIIKYEKPDMIMSSHYHINIFLILIKKIYKFKVIVRQPFALGGNNKEWIRRSSKLYKYADLIIFQTNEMKRDYKKISKLTLNNSEVIYNPIKIKRNIHHDEPNNQFFLSVGSLTKVKNHAYLIKKYINDYQKDNTIPSLYIVGEGPERTELQSLITDYQMEDKIKLIGQIEDVTPYYLNAKSLTISSLSEGLPNVLLEALSYKCNVIVKKHQGGTKEVLERVGLIENFVDEIDFIKKDYKKTTEFNLELLEFYFGEQKILQQYKDEFSKLI